MTAKKKNTPAEIAITSREIAGRILFVRGVQVILDSHIAELYGVETRRLNEQVKRNEARFPEHFRFQLTEEEWEGLSLQSDSSNSPDSLRSQNATLEPRENLKSQNATSSQDGRGKHRKYLPYVFTEQGVAMLSAVLRSETAVQVSIRIMEAFVQMRRYFLQNATLFQKIEQVETRQLKHIADSDEKFNRLFNALEDQSQKSPAQGIFFNGQIFDAYECLIFTAKKFLGFVDQIVDCLVSMPPAPLQGCVIREVFLCPALNAFVMTAPIRAKRNPGSYQPLLAEEEVPEVYFFNKALFRA